MEPPSKRQLRACPTAIAENMAEEAMLAWFSVMSGSVAKDFVTSLKRYSDLFGEADGNASACSGTEISDLCDKSITKVLADKFDIHIKLQGVIACEKNVNKQRWIMGMHDTPQIFNTLDDLTRTKALNVRSNKTELVKPFCKYTQGFPCISRTPLSSASSQNVNCVQQNREATGVGLNEGLAIIKKHWPQIVQLECVVGLAKAMPNADSDAEWIAKQLRALKFWAIWIPMDTQDCDSDVHRKRLWWVGARDLVGKRQTIDAWFLRMLTAFKAPHMVRALNYIKVTDTAVQELCDACEVPCILGTGMRQPDKAMKVEMEWKDFHVELFPKYGLSWPVQWQ